MVCGTRSCSPFHRIDYDQMYRAAGGKIVELDCRTKHRPGSLNEHSLTARLVSPTLIRETPDLARSISRRWSKLPTGAVTGRGQRRLHDSATGPFALLDS